MQQLVLKMLLSFLISFIICFFAYPKAIPFLHKIKFGQEVYDLGPQSHYKKNGTPTMGGVVFIIASILSCLITIPSAFTNKDFLILIFAYIGYGLIGFIDDFIIVVKKDHAGLKAKYKFLLQSILAIVFYLIYGKNHSNIINIPFINIALNIGIFYLFLVFFMFTGTSNAVNLSDGLDGLCAGLSIFAFIPYIYFCIRINLEQEAVLLVSVIGSLVGYLVYNHHPAQIFMGDTGSLALGGLLAAIAMITKEEVSLILIGGVFVLEVLSDIIQIGSYQLTGKRVFKMAPLHHHFELSGYSEQKVVWMFYSWGIILSILGIVIALVK